MVSRRIYVVLKRVSECSQAIVADILQIAFGLFSVGEIQPSLFKPVNLFVNGQRSFGVFHNSRFSIRLEDPPGALNKWEAREVISMAKIHIKIIQTTINDKNRHCSLLNFSF